MTMAIKMRMKTKTKTDISKGREERDGTGLAPAGLAQGLARH